MSIFDEHEKPFEFQKSQPSNLGSVQNFQKITVGVGNEKFEVCNQGLFLGAETFADAPFKVALDGSTTLKDILATGGQIVLAIPVAGGDSFIRAGKTDFTNTETGFILGVDDSDSDKPKFYIGSSTKYLNWDGTALTIRGTLNADDITAGTLLGRLVKAVGTGTGIDVWVNPSGTNGGALEFYSGATKIGFLAGNTTNSKIELQADNFLQARSGEDVQINFNSGGGTGEFLVYNDNTLIFQIKDDGSYSIWMKGDLEVGDDVYVQDNCSAASFTDRTPYYDGNAIEELKAIRSKVGTKEIDHDSLPEFMKKTVRVPGQVDKSTGVVIREEGTEVGRDLGAAVSMLIKAVQELNEKLDRKEDKKV